MKLNQITQAIRASGKLDANESLLFARQLEYISREVMKAEYVTNSAFSFFPVTSEVPAGATSFTYTMYDQVGLAKVISNYAKDLPRADVTAKQFNYPVQTIGISYGYNTQEIRSSQMTGMKLPADKAQAARDGHAMKINQLAFYGETEYGIPGFFTNANVPAVTIAADGTGATKTFSTKTADQIIRDVQSVINAIIVQSKGLYRPNVVALPVAQYAQLNALARSTTTDTTVMQFLRNTNPGVEFMPVYELAGSGTAGVDRMYAMYKSSDVLNLEIPMMLEEHAPQPQGLEFVVPMESRFAGVRVRRPLAIAYGEGI